MKRKIITISFAVLLFAACKTNSTDTEKTQDAVTETPGNTAASKWIANAETHEGMTNIKAALATYDQDKDVTVLTQNLVDQTQYIINNCTMEGEDHEQLHGVLHPILDAINALKEGTDDASKEVAIESVRTNINQYFELFTTK